MRRLTRGEKRRRLGVTPYCMERRSRRIIGRCKENIYIFFGKMDQEERDEEDRNAFQSLVNIFHI